MGTATSVGAQGAATGALLGLWEPSITFVTRHEPCALHERPGLDIKLDQFAGGLVAGNFLHNAFHAA